MSFTSWQSYESLLNLLGRQRGDWDSADSFEEFDRLVRDKCHDAVGLGYETLCDGLSGDFVHKDDLFEQVKLVALAQPAINLGLGDEWRGYYVSETASGQEVFAQSRYAARADWEKLEVSSLALSLEYDAETGLMYDDESWYLRDGTTEVWPDAGTSGGFRDADGNLYIRGELQADTVQDLREPHYDEESERWRKFNDVDSAFEYYSDADGVWERYDAGSWYRYHSAQFGWLAYREQHMTWLDPTSQDELWRSHGEIGMPATVAAGAAGVPAAPAEPAVPVGSPAGKVTGEAAGVPAAGGQVAQMVAGVRDQVHSEVLSAAQAAGLVPGRVTPEQLEEYVDKLMVEALAGSAA